MFGVALAAGFIDAIAGGGGLLTTPALLFAGVPPINAIATNKLQSTFGTAMATVNFARAGLLDWRAHLPAVAWVFLGSAAGVLVVQQIDRAALMLVIPALLIAVAGYVLLSPRMEDIDREARLSERTYRPIAGGIGFYDGFFGPGTGSFFNASLVGLRGMGLTRATGAAKLLNVTSNLAALLLWVFSGYLLWWLGLVMAAGSLVGGWLGSHSAIRFGAPLIRPMLVAISLALTAKATWDYFGG
ncbi:MAG: hypothetical protein B7Z33_02795 [Sphingomonadales bacterium 12-68-11]|nr:MAG: hypothetical protein B7Z33_02795 [Sphingomonadales bacterium 12-68-11]